MYSNTEVTTTAASPMAQEKRRNWVLIDACLVGLSPLPESVGERLEDIKCFGMGLSPKSG